MTFQRTIYSTLEECLAGVDLVVEATRFEQMCLWKEFSPKIKWVEDMGGWLPTVGKLDGRPIVMSTLFATIGDEFVLFYHPTSIVVDYIQLEDYLRAHCPVVNRIGFRDASNFNPSQYERE